MNERLQKFLWIDDPRIRRWGRLNGMICLISGFIVMLLSPLFYLGAKIVGKLASEATSAYTSLLLEHLESGTKAYRIAYQMDKELPEFMKRIFLDFPSRCCYSDSGSPQL